MTLSTRLTPEDPRAAAVQQRHRTELERLACKVQQAMHSEKRAPERGEREIKVDKPAYAKKSAPSGRVWEVDAETHRRG